MTRCPRCQRRFPQSGACAVHGRPSVVVDVHDAAVHQAPPGWTFVRHLATGGTSLVYALERGGQPAILKVARYRDREIHGRFVTEAEVLTAVGPPTTPAFVEAGEHDRYAYIVMEHVAGETLADWMARNGDRGGLGEIVAILTRVASALASLHQAGYVHRDFKPENVVIGPKGARLLDFGLAKPLHRRSAGVTQAGTVVGTVHYLAPEQIRTGGVVDHRSDVYSFGVVAYEMLAGVPPFVGERRAIEYQHQVARPPPLRDARTVPPELEALVLGCLAKQVEGRPQTFDDVRTGLSRAIASLGTIRGIGGKRESASPVKPLGHQSQVVLAWIEYGDPVEVASAVTGVQGTIVRQRGDGILAAFTDAQHDAPLALALTACRPLAHDRCRITIHTCAALVRRSAQGKATVYGPDVEAIERWLPVTPYTGLVLTEAAAAGTRTTAARDVPGFAREVARDRTDATDVHVVPPLVGRDNLVRNLVAAATGTQPMLIAISGGSGSGKSRVLAAVSERLAALGHTVVDVRGHRRFLGERYDDLPQLEALGGRRVILAIDDVHHFSPAAIRQVLAPQPITRIVTSRSPLFETMAGERDRLAIDLPALGYGDADRLLRELLRPARLLPDVLVERLAIRGTGNPGLLVALASDIKARGSIRRHPGSDEWYVAADELDTLLAPPGPSWFATRALDTLPVELARVLRAASALGPRFTRDEVAAITGDGDLDLCLQRLGEAQLLAERGAVYEFCDAALQDAIYEHALDDRELVHGRAYHHHLGTRGADPVGWLARVAFHAAGAGDRGNAATCWIALAREARARGEHDHADDLLARAEQVLGATAPPAIADALRTLGH